MFAGFSWAKFRSTLACLALDCWGSKLNEWVVMHKIKGLYDNGLGLSIRAISLELNISRNTLRKYLSLEELANNAASHG